MSDRVDEPELSISAVPGTSNDPLAEYTEEDVPTHLVEALVFEPRWLVQLTTFDRRMMDTEQLLAALDAGFVQQETLVWRGGMDDWQPLARALSLEGAARLTLPPVARRMSLAASPTLPPVMRSEPARASQPSTAAVIASVAIVVSIAAVTTSALAVGGVFETAPPAPTIRVAR